VSASSSNIRWGKEEHTRRFKQYSPWTADSLSLVRRNKGLSLQEWSANKPWTEKQKVEKKEKAKSKGRAQAARKKAARAAARKAGEEAVLSRSDDKKEELEALAILAEEKKADLRRQAKEKGKTPAARRARRAAEMKANRLKRLATETPAQTVAKKANSKASMRKSSLNQSANETPAQAMPGKAWDNASKEVANAKKKARRLLVHVVRNGGHNEDEGGDQDGDQTFTRG
jgi:hypothetical protein